METLPTLAAALVRAPAIRQAPATAPTDGLFEREVDRALERAPERAPERVHDARNGQRLAEYRAAAVRERRSERDAGFERERVDEILRDGERPDAEPTQAVVDGPVARTDVPPAEAGAAPATAGTQNPGGATSTAPGTTTGPAEPPPSSTPLVALPAAAAVAAPFAPQAQGPARAVAAGPVGAAGTQPAPGVEAVEGRTATFVHAARGGRAGATVPSTPAGDAALVEHAAEVLRQIRLALSPSARRVVVDLNPDELGRLSIRMTMHDGRVSALVRAESPQTLELLERHLPELRAVLAERGLEAGNLELELGFGSEARGESRRSFAAPAPLDPTQRTHEVPADEPTASTSSRTPLDGSVDTYA